MDSNPYYQDSLQKSSKVQTKKMKDLDRYQYSDFHHQDLPEIASASGKTVDSNSMRLSGSFAAISIKQARNTIDKSIDQSRQNASFKQSKVMSSYDAGSAQRDMSKSSGRKLTYASKHDLDHQIDTVDENHDDVEQRTLDDVSQQSERVYAPDIKFKQNQEQPDYTTPHAKAIMHKRQKKSSSSISINDYSSSAFKKSSSVFYRPQKNKMKNSDLEGLVFLGACAPKEVQHPLKSRDLQKRAQSNQRSSQKVFGHKGLNPLAQPLLRNALTKNSFMNTKVVKEVSEIYSKKEDHKAEDIIASSNVKKKESRYDKPSKKKSMLPPAGPSSNAIASMIVNGESQEQRVKPRKGSKLTKGHSNDQLRDATNRLRAVRKPDSLHKDILASSHSTSLELTTMQTAKYIMKGPKSTMARDSESCRQNLLNLTSSTKIEKQISDPQVQNLMPLKKSSQQIFENKLQESKITSKTVIRSISTRIENLSANRSSSKVKVESYPNKTPERVQVNRDASTSEKLTGNESHSVERIRNEASSRCFQNRKQSYHKKIDSQQDELNANFLIRKQQTLKRVFDHKENMRRIHELGNPLVCQAISVEPYIKRAILKMGWKENLSKENDNFHVKFDVADIQNLKLKPGQLYNHFPDNRQITTKAGLCKNMYTLTSNESQLQLNQLFPRCFDLSDSKQVETFLIEYQHTLYRSIIYILATQLTGQLEIANLVEESKRSKLFEDPRVFDMKFDQMCNNLDGTNLGSVNKQLECVRQVFTFCQRIASHLNDEHKSMNKSRWQPSQENFEQLKVSNETLELVSKLHRDLLDQKTCIARLNIPTNIAVQIVKLHEKLQLACPQYKSIDGFNNVWVVKPSFNARGLGIYCANQLKDIIQVGKKCQPKVVQKYIERPFLSDDDRKFDVRQWVLVTSWEPLDAFIFDTAYLKLCSSKFSLDDLKDIYKHISNYSIQKNTAGVDQQNSGDARKLIMSADEFASSQPGSFTWREDVMPKIDDVVYRTLKNLVESQTSEQKGQCFELYGFDLVLDEQLNPWVIEINLSPACSEREEWLSKMLDDMALDLTCWIERKVLTCTNHVTENFNRDLKLKKDLYHKQRKKYLTMRTLNSSKFHEQNRLDNKWQRLHACIDELQQWERTQQQLSQSQSLQGHNFLQPIQKDTLNTQTLHLEVTGRKADLRYERKLDVNWNKIEKTKVLQNIYRGSRARKQVRLLRENNASIIIQKQARVVLAKRTVRQMRLNNACIQVQRNMRRILAKLEHEKRIAERILSCQNFVAIKLQSHFRRKLASQVVHERRQHYNATILQKFMRGLRAFKVMLKERELKVLTIRIQRFYKKRFQMRQVASVIVQKILKRYQAQRRVKIMLKVSQASSMLRNKLEKAWLESAFSKLNMNSKIIRIQCCYRQRMARCQLTLRQTQQAQEKVKDLIMAFQRQSKLNVLRELVMNMQKSASRVQTYLAKYLALRRLSRLQQKQIFFIDATETLQKFIKGKLVFKSINKQLKLRKAAAIQIQTKFKSLRAKKLFLKKKEACIFIQKNIRMLSQQFVYKLMKNTLREQLQHQCSSIQCSSRADSAFSTNQANLAFDSSFIIKTTSDNAFGKQQSVQITNLKSTGVSGKRSKSKKRSNKQELDRDVKRKKSSTKRQRCPTQQETIKQKFEGKSFAEYLKNLLAAKTIQNNHVASKQKFLQQSPPKLQHPQKQMNQYDTRIKKAQELVNKAKAPQIINQMKRKKPVKAIDMFQMTTMTASGSLQEFEKQQGKY